MDKHNKKETIQQIVMDCRTTGQELRDISKFLIACDFDFDALSPHLLSKWHYKLDANFDDIVNAIQRLLWQKEREE